MKVSKIVRSKSEDFTIFMQDQLGIIFSYKENQMIDWWKKEVERGGLLRKDYSESIKKATDLEVIYES